MRTRDRRDTSRPQPPADAVADDVRALLLRARAALDGGLDPDGGLDRDGRLDRGGGHRDPTSAARAVLDDHLRRLDAPLRVALAGKTKAGKSTLLNALLGTELAPTGHAECTRVVTVYRYADAPAVTLHPLRGAPRAVPPRRGPSGLEIDLGTLRPEDVARIEVAWPAPGLRDTTFVDTPGLDSVSSAVSQRADALLAAHSARTTQAGAEPEPGADVDPDLEVDAVVYLLRHLHATDVRTLQVLRDARAAGGSSIGTVAVLSRADEVGVGRIDAMIAAGRVAERYRGDRALAPLCQTVVPVAGLLALAAQTLREDELADLRALARLDRSVTEDLLLSVDRFRRPSLDLPVEAHARADLLDRFGVFGLRLVLVLLRDGDRRTAALADELLRRSGMAELRRVLDAQLAQRRDTGRARAALLALRRVLAEHPVPGGRELAAQCERLELAAHGVRELDVLEALRVGAGFEPSERAVAERLLGAAGSRAVDRLGLPDDAPPAAVAAAAARARALWSARAEDPLLDRDARRACRVAIRTCDRLLADVSPCEPARA